MAGNVEVGGNGSVHWRVKTGKSEAVGMDDDQHDESLTVEVCYESPEDARVALANVKVQGKCLVLAVKANKGKTEKYKAPAQVTVRW